MTGSWNDLKRTHCFLLALVPALIAVDRVAADGDPSVRQQWRNAEHGGINALYCYLRVNGCKVDYESLVRESPGRHPANSLNSLATLSAKHDLPLTSVSMTFNELADCRLPIIVHINDLSPESGAFLLVFGVRNDGIYYMNGPTASIHRLDLESFRRVWSGFALVPSRKLVPNPAVAMCGLVVGLVLGVSFRGLRARCMQ